MVGIPVGNEFQVNTTTVDNQDDPNVAIDAQGNYVVVWQSGDEESNSGIFAQRYDRFGNAIGGEIEITADDTRPEFDPVVGMDADGNFVVAWTDGGGDNNEVRARRFDRDGNALSDAFLVNTETADNQDTPTIAMNVDGQFVIAWESLGQDGDSNGIFAQMYDRDGNPVGDEIAVNDITNGSQDDAVVAIDGSGNFVVAWEDSSTDIETINARRFDSTGTPIDDSFVVSTTAGIDHDTPAIAMNDSGEFVIAWESFDDLDGDRHGVFAQRYNSAGETIGDEIAVNTTTTEDQDKPSVAIDAEGNFLITWESDDQDGSEEGVFGQYFDNTGVKQGSEFQINTFTEGEQDEVAVAMTPEGNAIVTWESLDQDGDGGGIFAQQLAVPASVEFSQSTFRLNEDGSAVGAEVPLTRDHDLIESEVQVSVAGGTATPGLDFTDIFPLSVTFASGETTQTISIPVIEDAIVEGPETVELKLTAISNAEIGEQSATTIDIIDNDIVKEVSPVDPAPVDPGIDPGPVAPGIDPVPVAPGVDPAPADPGVDLAPTGLKIRGSAGDDKLRGSDGDDIIRGRAGNDKLRGFDGSDRLIGGTGNDRLVGGSGDDNLRGNGGNDRLIGQTGDDLLNGGGGNDRLKGGAGGDELVGGRGDDTLIGGAGSDIFVLKQGNGTDFIRDFNIGEDQIRLQGSLSFRDLSFEQQGNKTLIDAGGETLAELRGVQVNQLDRASFV